MTDLFISYSRKDLPFVQRLYDALKEAQRDVWIDLEDIPPTAEWLEEIYAGIEGSNTFVFVISPDSVVSEVCKLELEHAIKNNKRLIPVLHRDVTDRRLIHPALASHNWLFFREQDNFERSLKWLTDALDTDLAYVRMHTRLLVRAVEWEDRQRDESFLLRGTDLVGAENWLSGSMGQQPEPTQLHNQYVLASRRAATARQRITLAGVSLGLVVSLMLAALSFFLYRQAEDARQRAANSEGTAVAALISVNDTRATAQAQEASFRATINALDINRPASTPTTEPGGGDDPDLTTTAVAIAPTDLLPQATPTESFVASAPTLTAEAEVVAEATEEPSGIDLLLAVENIRRADTPEARAAAKNNLLTLLQTQNVTLSTALTGHNGAVQDVAYSPNGAFLASASDDNTIILWDAATLERVGLPFFGHTAGVTSVDFSPDGQRLVSGSRDQSVIIWDTATGQVINRLAAHQSWVLSALYSPDGQMIASASGDGAVLLWDASSGEHLRAINGHEGGTFSIAFSPDGRTLASGGADGYVILWDVATGEEVQRLHAHRAAVFAVAFSPDGQTLASGGGDNTAIVWRVNSDRRGAVEPVYTLVGPSRSVLSAAFSPDGQTLAVGTAENVVMLWDVPTAQRIGGALDGYRDWVYSTVFSPDGNTLASGSSDGSVVLWDISGDAWIAQACALAGRSLTGEEWENAFPGEPYRETCPGL